MFEIFEQHQVYSDPWNISLFSRLAQLSRGDFRIAYYYEAPNNSTFRYRAYNMVQAVNELSEGRVSASYFFQSDLAKLNDLVELADVLVICRSGYNQHVNELICRFRARNKIIYFDIDDLVFDNQFIHLIINTLGQDINSPQIWDYWFAYVGRMGQTLRLCDGAITTNDYLAGRITDFCGLKVKVVKNFINKEQEAISRRIFAQKKVSNFKRNEKVTLGYFSGSPSHQLDFEIITPALKNLMSLNNNLELFIVGYITPGELADRFGSRIRYEPFQDYVNLQRLIAQADFNLMPLQANIFTNCKSELKYFEASIVGTLSIASPTYTYAKAIQNAQNGYISMAHEWEAKIYDAISNLQDYPEMAKKSQRETESSYLWSNQIKEIYDAFGLN